MLVLDFFFFFFSFKKGYFNSLRMELAGTGINVQVVCPGPVKSNIAAYSSTEEKDKVSSGLIFLC